LKSKTYKIVNLIAKYLSKNNTIYEDEIINDLLQMGFDSREIDNALYWLETMGISFDNFFYKQESSNNKLPKNFRILTKEETDFLTKDAINYLYLLKKKGLVDDDIFESILERVVISTYGNKVGLEDIKLLTALTAYNNNKNLFDYILNNETEVIYN